MGRRALLLIASILVAATGTGVVALYAQSADRRANEQQTPQQVLVAKADIPAGSSAASVQQSLDTGSFAKAFVPADAVTSAAQLNGLTTKALIRKGQPLQLSQFAQPDEPSTANPLGLEKGKIAVSVLLPDNARVAGFVQDGSYVALYVTAAVSDSGPRGEISLLVESAVKVLKVAPFGSRVPTAGQTLVTLQLDPVDAPKVIFASQKDVLYMALLESRTAGVGTLLPFSGDYNPGND